MLVFVTNEKNLLLSAIEQVKIVNNNIVLLLAGKLLKLDKETMLLLLDLEHKKHLINLLMALLLLVINLVKQIKEVNLLLLAELQDNLIKVQTVLP